MTVMPRVRGDWVSISIWAGLAWNRDGFSR